MRYRPDLELVLKDLNLKIVSQLCEYQTESDPNTTAWRCQSRNGRANRLWKVVYHVGDVEVSFPMISISAEY